MLAPKAAKLNEYVAPHKPHTKLAEVLAKHKGQADWVEPVVDDDNLHADYISMGPGKKTPRRMNADTREWWVDSGRPDSLHDRRPGTVRGLEGVPRSGAVPQHVHDGDGRRSAVAALRSEHREGPQDVSDGREARADAGLRLRAGSRRGQGRLRGRQQAVRRFQRRRGRHRQDAPLRARRSRGREHHSRARAFRRRRSPTRGTSTRRAPSSGSSSSTRFATTSKGCRSSRPTRATSSTCPKMRFHLASFAGNGPSCRLAMNGYTDLSHSYEADEAK